MFNSLQAVKVLHRMLPIVIDGLLRRFASRNDYELYQ